MLGPTGPVILASYTYDPLDRLRIVDHGAARTRFRYVGLTTSVAQTVDDTTGSVLRSIGTNWTGERLLDWTGTNSNIRYYGTNAHHDTVWTADSTGAVSATLRYDPWGTLTSSTGSNLPDFRFQGSWFDTATSLSWVVTRWYAPSLGRFLSEDSLLGAPVDPPSEHLYAYASGEPVGHWDPDGRWSIWDWVRWFKSPHDAVVTCTALEVFFTHFGRGKVYADVLAWESYSATSGGRGGGSGRPDVAWKIHENRVDLWEVKYESDFGRREGRRQLARYINALAVRGIDARGGADLPPGYGFPVIARPGVFVSWHSEGGGLVLYRTSYRPPVPVPGRRRSYENETERPPAPFPFSLRLPEIKLSWGSRPVPFGWAALRAGGGSGRPLYDY